MKAKTTKESRERKVYSLSAIEFLGEKLANMLIHTESMGSAIYAGAVILREYETNGITTKIASKLLNNSRGVLKNYDAFVFYDMWQDISDTEKEAYLKFLEQGMGMVFLHHSIAAWPAWEEYADYMGVEMFWSHFDSDKTRSLITDIGFTIEFGRDVESGGEKHHWLLARKGSA